MFVTTVKEVYEKGLRSVAENPRSAAAVSPDLQNAVPLKTGEETHLDTSVSILSSASLPDGIDFSQTREKGETPSETVKIVCQELLLPSIGSIWGDTKPYVTGAQAVWATKEFWDAISDEKVDATKRTIKGLRVAKKALSALLLFEGASALPTNVNMIAGFILATADKLYVVRGRHAEERPQAGDD